MGKNEEVSENWDFMTNPNYILTEKELMKWLNKLNKDITAEKLHNTLKRIKMYPDIIVREKFLIKIKEKTKYSIKVLRETIENWEKQKVKENKKNVFGEEEDKIKTSLYIENNKIIAEQVKQKNISKFCIYNVETKEIKYTTEITTKNNEKLIPINDEEVIKEVITLPEKAEEYGDDNKLDEEIKTFITKWLDIPEDTLQFALWNIKRSWVFERFHTLNYLRALGDIGMGKSRFLDTLGCLHYKPIQTSGATTSAPIFRMIEKWRGTLIMDEADFKQSDESQDIIKIINQGYERGKWIMRCDQQINDKIQFFDPYCPKIIATRKTFTDKAMESRCITEVMKGTNNKKIPVNLNKIFFEEAKILRNKLLMWRFNNYFKIKTEIPVEIMDEFDELEPRVRQVTSSFLSLFMNDEKQLEIFKRFVMKYQEDIIEERKNSFDGQIVAGIHSLLEKDIVDFDVKDIIEEIQLKNKHGNLVNSRSISSNLKSLGFEKGVPKRVNEKTKRCVPIDDKLLYNLFKRYGYSVTVVTVLGGIADKIIYSAKKEKKEGGVTPENRNTVTTVINKGFVPLKTVKKTIFNHNCNTVNNVTESEKEFVVGKPIPESVILGEILQKMEGVGVLDHDDILNIIDDPQAESLIVKWCRNGDIFECKPGRYKKI